MIDEEQSIMIRNIKRGQKWLYSVDDTFSAKILENKIIMEGLNQNRINLSELSFSNLKVSGNCFARAIYLHILHFMEVTVNFNDNKINETLPLLLCENFDISSDIPGIKHYAKEAYNFCSNLMNIISKLDVKDSSGSHKISKLYENLLKIQIGEKKFIEEYNENIFGYSSTYIHAIFYLLKKHQKVSWRLAIKSLKSETNRLSKMMQIIKNNGISKDEFRYPCGSHSKNKKIVQSFEYRKLKINYCKAIQQKLFLLKELKILNATLKIEAITEYYTTAIFDDPEIFD